MVGNSIKIFKSSLNTTSINTTLSSNNYLNNKKLGSLNSIYLNSVKNKLGYSTLSYLKLQNPWYVTGFSDAESCFSVQISKLRNHKNWAVQLRFEIYLHIEDLAILEEIKAFFGVGSILISKNSRKVATFRVSNLNDITNVIIPHFVNFPLQSAKSIDFNLWKSCAILVTNKEHLTDEGIQKLIHLKSALNKGLSETLKLAFPTILVLARPIYKGPTSPLNPYWVSGFIDGDGSFTVNIEAKTGYVNLRIIIGLNYRENPLIKKISEFFGVGRINSDSNQKVVYYTVGNLKDIYNKIIPHFDTYPLIGNKQKNYLIWKEIFIKVNSKAHLSEDGLNEIKELRSKLNKYLDDNQV